MKNSVSSRVFRNQDSRNTLLHSAMLAFSLSFAATSYGGVHFSVKGSAVNSNYVLQSQDKAAISGSVDVDIGRHFRIGVTHRLERSDSKGYTRECDECDYYYEKSRAFSTANSLDLTFILYYGRIFLPYLKLGIVKKDYLYKTESQGQVVEDGRSMPEVPNAGAGVGIKLSRQFSLNLSYNRSPGILLEDPNDVNSAYVVMDSYTSVGISYQM